jgi:hypothetical protein
MPYRNTVKPGGQPGATANVHTTFSTPEELVERAALCGRCWAKAGVDICERLRRHARFWRPHDRTLQVRMIAAALHGFTSQKGGAA